MDAIRIKKDFHSLIDGFNDIHLLKEFYEIISIYSQRKNNIDILDELSTIQKSRLTESIQQLENRDVLEHHEVKANLKKWLEK